MSREMFLLCAKKKYICKNTIGCTKPVHQQLPCPFIRKYIYFQYRGEIQVRKYRWIIDLCVKHLWTFMQWLWMKSNINIIWYSLKKNKYSGFASQKGPEDDRRKLKWIIINSFLPKQPAQFFSRSEPKWACSNLHVMLWLPIPGH